MVIHLPQPVSDHCETCGQSSDEVHFDEMYAKYTPADCWSQRSTPKSAEVYRIST